jgi:predicted phage terminase large subunit-like protein
LYLAISATDSVSRLPSDGVSLLDWGRHYLPEHFRQPPSRMHLWLSEQLDVMHRRRGTKINVIGPRGSAKSTVAALAYVLRAALEEWESYIMLVGDTQYQAASHLENIRRELRQNKILRRAYRAATGPGMTLRQNRVQFGGGVTIEAFGAGQSIRGRRRGAHRPTLIVCDDLQNEHHMESSYRREQSNSWFDGTLMKAGTKRTNVINLATALHRDALAMQLDGRPGWKSRVFRSIERWPKDMTLWQQWEATYVNSEDQQREDNARRFFQSHRQQMEAGVRLLWPEEEDLYTLMCMRAEGGHTAFAREKQSSPIDPDRCEWPESCFGNLVWFDSWPGSLRLKTMALDPSKGADARGGDYSAYVMLGIGDDGVMYVEADLARRPTTQMIADGVELCRTFRPDAFGVESNQFQELLCDQFEEEFRGRKFWDVRPWTVDNRVNKRVRIRRLGPYLATRRMRFKSNSPATRLLVEQLREFPLGAHDDGPDALEMAIRLAVALVDGRQAGDGLGDRLEVDV